MKEFDPWPVQCNCSPALDGADVVHKKGENVAWWIGPVQFCAWNRGFYFQPIVLEFDFAEYAPKHGSKRTLMMPRFQGEKRKLLRGLQPDGRNESYPVLSFYICVNRGKFPMQDDQNQVEWLTSRTARSEGIAHELLYGDQYAKNFDPQKFDPRNPSPTFDVHTPTPAEDKELLCPSYEIEAMLHGVEAFYGIKFSKVDEFVMQQQTEMMGRYYRSWLKKHAVEATICENRTIKYLESGVRANHDQMRKALEHAQTETRMGPLDAQSFLRHMRDNTQLCQEYIRQLGTANCLPAFQSLHKETCIASNKRAGKHECKAALHVADIGCSACRCDITQHTKMLIERDRDRPAG